MAYDVKVRQELNNRGISNDQIGYDQNTGYVTVGGQNFMKPQMNIQGTTFTDMPSFNQAFNSYQQATQPSVTSNMNVQPMQQPQPVSYTNPMDSQINDLIASIMNQMNNRQPFDPYSSPDFAAQEARSQRAAQQGIRAAQEAMGSAGFGRSTALGERAQRIQNEQEDFLRTQVIPQIIAQEEARRQQEFANMMSVLNPMMAQQGIYDSRNQFDRNFALQEGQLTGNYIPPEAQAIIDNILELKRQAEMPGVQGQELEGFRSQADALRSQLAGMGIDPSFIGSDVSRDVALQNRMNVGIPTLDAQQLERGIFESDRAFEYQAARDAIADERYKLEFDENARRWGLQFALDEAISRGQLDVARMNAQTSRMSANQSATNARINQLMNVWQTTGFAPAGLESLGVAEGTPLPVNEQQTQPMGASDYKTNSEFASDYSYVINNPEQAKKQLKENAADFIQAYGYDGYRALVNGLPEEDQSNLLKFLEE